MSNSVQIIINVTNIDVREKLIAELSTLDIDGFEEEEDKLICYYTEKKVNGTNFIKILNHYSLSGAQSIIYEKNWNAVWESSFEPVVVDNFCTIRAEFHEIHSETPYEIVITPKMSFGTGHHATTYLMVQQMAVLDFEGKQVADFGTGTGVLAILAEKLGSSSILAVDNDDWSIENAKENFERNNCKVIRLEKDDSFNTPQQFDIILANLNKNTILQNLHGLVFGLKTGGTILLSGILKGDEEVVIISLVKNNFTHVSTVEKDDWISLLFSLK